MLLQDDSDDEPSSTKQTSDALDLMELSCEEGEETASSEVHSEVSFDPLSSIHKMLFRCGVLFGIKPFFVFLRKMNWMAVILIPRMMRKSGLVTVQGTHENLYFC